MTDLNNHSFTQARLRSDTQNEVVEAATKLLARIDNITTVEFEYGGDRDEREALRDALARLAALA